VISLGVDVGGTNTDIILGGLPQGVVVHKLPSTSDDPARGTVQGTREICELAGISPGDIGLVLHGTTVATNTLLEHDGARTGMLTTEGFRDIVHIGRHQRPHNFSLMQDIAYQRWPLVERKHRKAVPERIVPPGVVATPLDEAACVEAILELRDRDVESICVCFLFSFLDPAHELRAGALIAEHHPDADVSLSHQVVAQFREFERFTTTAANAYVKPKVRRYLERLELGWRDAGVRCPIHVMQSNGGVAVIEQAAANAVGVLLSGPAAGVIAGRHIGTTNGHDHLITLDIGGTSADISVIPGRLLEMNARESQMGGYPILSPKLDVTAIGAGGGSIAWKDTGGAFNVGPRSAGADPGPAAYGRGGTEPTVTDAHVVLGRIPPHLLGGEIPLDVDTARKGLDTLAGTLGLTLEAAATGILEISAWNQANALRQVTVKRGLDVRDFTMTTFGGSGSLLLCRLADVLGLAGVLVPRDPGNVSAFGLLTVDVRNDYVRTAVSRHTDLDVTALSGFYDDLQEQAAGSLDREGFDRSQHRYARSADLRYAGQAFEVRVPAPDGPVNGSFAQTVVAAFHDAHEQLYGYAFRDDPRQPAEWVNLRVSGIGPIERPRPRDLGSRDGDVERARTGVRPVFFDDWTDTPVYWRADLAPGDVVSGPAVVEEFGSTVPLHPGFRATVDRFGNLVVRRGPS
jgi:N-methylhydantoinase A